MRPKTRFWYFSLTSLSPKLENCDMSVYSSSRADGINCNKTRLQVKSFIDKYGNITVTRTRDIWKRSSRSSVRSIFLVWSLSLLVIADCIYLIIPWALSGFIPEPVPPSFSGSANWTTLFTCLNFNISGGTLPQSVFLSIRKVTYFGTTSYWCTHLMWCVISLLNSMQNPALPVRGAPNVITFIHKFFFFSQLKLRSLLS